MDASYNANNGQSTPGGGVISQSVNGGRRNNRTRQGLLIGGAVLIAVAIVCGIAAIVMMNNQGTSSQKNGQKNSIVRVDASEEMVKAFNAYANYLYLGEAEVSEFAPAESWAVTNALSGVAGSTSRTWQMNYFDTADGLFATLLNVANNDYPREANDTTSDRFWLAMERAENGLNTLRGLVDSGANVSEVERTNEYVIATLGACLDINDLLNGEAR